jgi:hypothetical protein
MATTDERLTNLTVGRPSGGDSGEGLDFEGEFVYAVDVAGYGSVQVGDAVFTGSANREVLEEDLPDEETARVAFSNPQQFSRLRGTPGFTITARWGGAVPVSGTYTQLQMYQGPPVGNAKWRSYGTSTDDMALASLARTEYFVVGPISMSMEGLILGKEYQLQLLITCHDQRRFNVVVNGDTIWEEFSPGRTGDCDHNPYGMAFIRKVFTAQDTVATAVLTGLGYGAPFLYAVTLELLNPDVVPNDGDEPLSNATGSKALRLVDDAYVQLDAMVLGKAIAVSAWVQVGTAWDGTHDGMQTGFTIFNSFQDDTCGDTDVCRNKVGAVLDRGGWFALGNDIASKRPLDLFVAGTTFEHDTAHSFWGAATESRWVLVTVSVSVKAVSVYQDGELLGRGTRTRALPRMLRRNVYIGSAHGAPFQAKHGDTTLALADFRLYDRSVSFNEAHALFINQDAECCIESGLKDVFGVNNLDLDLRSVTIPAAVSISVTEQTAGSLNNADPPPPASTLATSRAVDICGEVASVSECHGVITDGAGPYGRLEDCGVALDGFIGATFTISIDEFETVQGDVLYIYDGPSAEAPQLVALSGSQLQSPTPISSSGATMFVRFVSDDDRQADGFRLSFSCTGIPVEYVRPADVATPLNLGIVGQPASASDGRSACFDRSLLSVQCCADALLSCSNSRVTGISLQGMSLRGSIPPGLGDLQALQSLKLNSNFLTGTLPHTLSQLHLLKELSVSQNQLAMQERGSLGEILGGLMNLRTLDLGMSDEVADYGKTVIQPTPPLDCRVGEVCQLQVVLRTAGGLHLPHGGQVMTIHKGSLRQLCEDRMDGSYLCILSTAWIARREEFEFELRVDDEEFVPVRTLLDPTTGIESTVNTYPRLGINVLPIQCVVANSRPNSEASACVCNEGFYKVVSASGSFSCEHCSSGQEPVDEGTRCQSCPFGKYSAAGTSCEDCEPGLEPNDVIQAIECVQCGQAYISWPGEMCSPCPVGQEADALHIHCVCPRDTYNSSALNDNVVQCIGEHNRGKLANKLASDVCTPCGSLPCVTCGNVGLRIQPGWSNTSTDHHDTVSPWFVFQCPNSDACINSEEQRCQVGHEGVLCNVCMDGYGRSDNVCTKCNAVNRSPIATLLLLGVTLATVAALYYFCCASTSDADKQLDGTHSSLQVQLTDNPLQHDSASDMMPSAAGVAQRSEHAYLFVRVMYQPSRILIGYFQVVSQIGIVLDIALPPKIQYVFDQLSPLAMNLKTFFQLDCMAAVGFYEEWCARVFILPLLMIAMVALRYYYERRRNLVDDAGDNFRANLFVIVFLLYPSVSNAAFSMFNCKAFDGSQELLHTDYRISCNTSVHKFYCVIALFVIVGFSIGTPATMVCLMLRRMREYSSENGSERFVARRVADDLKIDDRTAADAIHDVATGREYSFLVNAFKSRYYFWEGIDCGRKLLLVGMLVLAGRGSVLQLFVAVCVSFVSLALQLVLQPYKHPEDNLFKVATDVHICLVVTISLIIKALGDHRDEEVLAIGFYDSVLVLTFIFAIPVTFVYSVRAKRTMMRQTLRDRASEDIGNASIRAKQRAIQLLNLGVTNNDDLRLLSSYFQMLENMVNKWSHVFISYRVASDRVLARRLYDDLSAVTLDETGQKLRVYLDQTRLEDGQRWDSGFMEGLAKSWVFVPVVSVGSVSPMATMSESQDWCDNVLLEWASALELHQRGRVKAVLPLLVGRAQADFFSEAHAAFGGLSALPTSVSTSTIEQVVTHLSETTGDGSTDGLSELLQQTTGGAELTIQGIVSSVLKFQGVKLSEEGAGIAHGHGTMGVGMENLSECVDRVQTTVSACLKRVGMEEEADGYSAGMQQGAPGNSKLSILGRVSQKLAKTSSASSSGREPGSPEWAAKGTAAAATSSSPMEIQFGDAGGGMYLASN